MAKSSTPKVEGESKESILVSSLSSAQELLAKMTEDVEKVGSDIAINEVRGCITQLEQVVGKLLRAVDADK